MRIESLAYFLEIAQSGSFSLAARRLYVSQQGLSKSVQALERELDTVLFERAGKRLRLTDAGRALVPLARTCIEDQRALKEAMRPFSRPPAEDGKPHLVAMPFVASGLFTAMREQLDARGLRNVVLEEKGLPEIMRALAGSGAEAGAAERAAMVAVPDPAVFSEAEGGGVSFVPLFESSIVLMGTRELVSPRKRFYTVQEVSLLPVACYSEPVLDGILEKMFSGCPLRNVVMHASNLPMLDEYVSGGRAVTFSDSFSAYLDAGASDLLFMPVKDAPSFSVGFAYAPSGVSRRMLDYIARFKACVEEACGPYLAKHPLTRP